jgi:lysophospholipase L1-like esterase
MPMPPRRHCWPVVPALRSSVDGVTDNTHFSPYGATQMGGLVLQSIREQRLPLAAYLR